MKILADGYLRRDDGVIEIDPDIVYPRLMVELRLTDASLTQYWLEVMFQCAKLDAQRLLQGTDADSRADGIPLQIHIMAGRVKQRWQLKRHPVGRGIHAATKGKEARGHFRKLRGSLPGKR